VQWRAEEVTEFGAMIAKSCKLIKNNGVVHCQWVDYIAYDIFNRVGFCLKFKKSREHMRILEGLSSAHCTSGFPCISESDKTIRTPHPVKERNCEVWFIFMTWHMTEKRELFIYHSNITH
jgi:hypothetical protein